MEGNKTILKRKLRHDSTVAEQLFWSKVSNRQFLNLKFRRQHSIGNFIVDFCCPEKHLIVEIDGDTHFTPEGIISDQTRTALLNAKGYKIIRYNNLEVMDNIDGVFADMANKLLTFSTLT